MRRSLPFCLLLLLLALVANCAWAACDAQGELSQIAAQACGVCGNEFPGQEAQVEKVIADDSGMWVCLGDRLIEELEEDRYKLNDLVQNIRNDPDIQWRGKIYVCSCERGNCI